MFKLVTSISGLEGYILSFFIAFTTVTISFDFQQSIRKTFYAIYPTRINIFVITSSVYRSSAVPKNRRGRSMDLFPLRNSCKRFLLILI